MGWLQNAEKKFAVYEVSNTYYGKPELVLKSTGYSSNEDALKKLQKLARKSRRWYPGKKSFFFVWPYYQHTIYRYGTRKIKQNKFDKLVRSLYDKLDE